MLNSFREPQGAIVHLQQILDDGRPAAVLSVDMSKAFERVNPFWALAVLRGRGAPAWLLRYAQYLFFGRKIQHKVQGRLLPPRVVRQGVDMGRAFSVFMFCVAMDPVYWALNRIPRSLGVEGYVDDCSVAGELPLRDSHETSSLAWLQATREIYDWVASAGFLVLDHDCFWSQECDAKGLPLATVTSGSLPSSVVTTSPCRKWPSL
jgi:hypothetical protein